MARTDTTWSNKGRGLVVRLVVASVSIAAWFWTQSLIGRRAPLSSGLGDGLHLLSAPLNLYLVQHLSAANALLIASSGLVDLLAMFVLAEWLFGRSVRPLLGLVIVVGLRQVVEGLCALPTPNNMVWHYPGFPSLLVTYSVANDYFFSAHTAIAVFAATELARLGRRWLKVLSVVIVVFEGATVLVLRAHYTMDVFTAIIAALYAAHLAERISPTLDRKLSRFLKPPADSVRSVFLFLVYAISIGHISGQPMPEARISGDHDPLHAVHNALFSSFVPTEQLSFRHEATRSPDGARGRAGPQGAEAVSCRVRNPQRPVCEMSSAGQTRSNWLSSGLPVAEAGDKTGCRLCSIRKIQ